MIETFIRRPVFTTMFILLLVVFGIRCYPEIGVDLNPDVDMPIVSVRVTYDRARYLRRRFAGRNGNAYYQADRKPRQPGCRL